MSNIYKLAARSKLRFATDRGTLSVEDLFSLSLTGDFSLNAIGMNIQRRLKDSDVESLVASDHKVNSETDTLTLQLDIIKDVIATRQAEQDEANSALAKRRRLAALYEAKEKKAGAALADMSVEDIDKEISTLTA